MDLDQIEPDAADRTNIEDQRGLRPPEKQNPWPAVSAVAALLGVAILGLSSIARSRRLSQLEGEVHELDYEVSQLKRRTRRLVRAGKTG